MARPRLQDLDDEWLRMGLIGNETKARDLVDSGKVSGIQFRDCVRLQSRGSKLWSLIGACADLSRCTKVSPDEIGVFNGHLQWQNLMCRPLYSCLHHTYGFVHMHCLLLSCRSSS